MLKVLPQNISNLIAAGEVVSRPASVVKELMENAVDAGARSILVTVLDAGKTLIQVIDDGCGMSPEEAVLCFERHATSKIHQADDLFAIHTMGFRGEALASIAAIAQVELRTRQADSELGTTVCIEGSVISSQQPTACPAGTSIAVKNLFFNVPARRNFLKKDSIELSHIEEVFRRITLVHHDIAFTLTHNGKNLYNLTAGSLLQRIAGLYGNNYKERLYAVDEQTDIVKIRGFVSRPEYSRRVRGEQYLFVNGRFIKHPALSAAVEKAYTDLLPERSYPSYFISLQVDPSRIDINIHPTKTEVKFVDEHALFAILRSAVKRAIGQFSLATELSFDTPEEFNIPPAPKDYIPEQPKISYNPNYNPFRATSTQTHIKDFKDLKDFKDSKDPKDPKGLKDLQAPLAPMSVAGSCLQLQNRYIVTALSSGLAIIDQQRAHERILYDKLTQSGNQVTKNSQTLLFPVNCSFTPADAELLNELLPELQQYGFDISSIGQTTFVVSATPADLKGTDLQPMLEQLLAEYKGATMQKFNNRAQSVCASLARQMAVRPGTALAQEQMQQLVADLFACPMADTSPSGKKIITIVKPEELLH